MTALGPPGQLRLVVLRLVLLVLAGLPAVVGLGFVDNADRPYFSDPPTADLQWVVIWLQNGLVDASAPLLLLPLVLGFLADQLLTAGALRWLSQERGRFELVGPGVIGEGTRWIWPQLRIAAVAGVLGGAWLAGVGAAMGALVTFPDEPLVPFGAAVGVLGLLTIGAWSHLTSVVVLIGGRRVVRKAGWLAAKLAWRHPLNGPVLYVGASLVAALLPAVVVVAWRLANPGSDWQLWAAGWVAALAVQGAIWLGLMRVGQGLLAKHDDLEQVPDEGFGLWAWVKGKAGR